MVSATVQLHKHPTLMTSNNATVFNLQEYSEQVKQEHTPEGEQKLGTLRKSIQQIVREQKADDWLIYARDQVEVLGLTGLVKDDWLQEEVENAQRDFQSPEREQNVFRGGDTFTWRITPEIVSGLIKQNMFHLLNAEQGTGKSCFCFGLFRELGHKRTGSFLNLDTDVSKNNWRLFLIGTDMSREGWSLPLQKYHLLTDVAQDSGLGSGTLDPGIAYMSCEEDISDSLSPQDIARYREMAVQCVADGFQPLFVFDSYRSLVHAYKDIDELKPAFANPLRDLKRAMAGTGATTIVLHHTPKSKGGSVTSSGAGTNNLGSIPDVVLLMEKEGEYSNRLVIHSRKRITEIDWMIEQRFEEGEWIGHGCARAWQRDREMQQKIATLPGVKARIFDWAQNLWETRQEGFTKKQVQSMLEVSKPAASNHVNWLLLNGLVYKGDKTMTVHGNTDVFYPYNAKNQVLVNQVNPQLTPEKKSGVYQKPCDSNGSDAENHLVNQVNPVSARNWVIPCHPVGTAVEHNGGNGWHVVEANLASGMHVIEKNGLRVKDLRMMDLTIHIDEDEEL